MRVMHLNYKESAGGAAAAASRLHGGLRQLGIDSRMIVVRRQSSRDPTVAALTGLGHDVGRLLGGVFRRSRRMLLPLPAKPPFHDDRGPYGRKILGRLAGSDIIHLHWVAKMFDVRSFLGGLPQSRPIVWTLHDFNPFTGGCHYPGTCRRFEESCGACPQLDSSDQQDRSYRTWGRKSEAYSGVRNRLNMVTPSRSLKTQALRSGLFRGFDVTCIPNGVDVGRFSPASQREARTALGVPTELPVVLFVAESVDNPLKGFKYLAAALSRLRQSLPRVTLLTCGAFRGPAATARHFSLGYVDTETLVQAYRAADVLVVPSVEDNLPNTVLESMACGTPVVGSAIGGIPDIVDPGLTGALVASGDSDALATAILTILNDAGLRTTMAENCRELALREYSVEVQARRYADLYESVVPR